MTSFSGYISLNEGMGREVYDYSVEFLSSVRRASVGEYKEIVSAMPVIKRRLDSIFRNVDRPSPSEVKAAWKVILEIPKLGAVLASLVAPVPFLFTVLMAVSAVLYKFTGVYVLPKRFHNIFLGPDTFLGKRFLNKMSD
jgi:hypothetical protein